MADAGVAARVGVGVACNMQVVPTTKPACTHDFSAEHRSAGFSLVPSIRAVAGVRGGGRRGDLALRTEHATLLAAFCNVTRSTASMGDLSCFALRTHVGPQSGLECIAHEPSTAHGILVGGKLAAHRSENMKAVELSAACQPFFWLHGGATNAPNTKSPILLITVTVEPLLAHFCQKFCSQPRKNSCQKPCQRTFSFQKAPVKSLAPPHRPVSGHPVIS